MKLLREIVLGAISFIVFVSGLFAMLIGGLAPFVGR
jgi:hypothetical protein